MSRAPSNSNGQSTPWLRLDVLLIGPHRSAPLQTSIRVGTNLKS
jgi:hypothetical protein